MKGAKKNMRAIVYNNECPEFFDQAQIIEDRIFADAEAHPIYKIREANRLTWELSQQMDVFPRSYENGKLYQSRLERLSAEFSERYLNPVAKVLPNKRYEDQELGKFNFGFDSVSSVLWTRPMFFTGKVEKDAPRLKVSTAKKNLFSLYCNNANLPKKVSYVPLIELLSVPNFTFDYHYNFVTYSGNILEKDKFMIRYGNFFVDEGRMIDEFIESLIDDGYRKGTNFSRSTKGQKVRDSDSKDFLDALMLLPEVVK